MQEELGDVKVIHFCGVRVRACEWDREKSAPGCWMASASSSSNTHQSQIGRRRKVERMGSGREDRCAVRSAQMSGVDSRWQEVCDLKPDTGALFCPEGRRERTMLPGGCPSESKMLMSSRSESGLEEFETGWVGRCLRFRVSASGFMENTLSPV